MRLFGILLIVFNLLAAGGFIYLATQDWQGRQDINAAGLRHLMLLQGVPLEGDAPFTAEGIGLQKELDKARAELHRLRGELRSLELAEEKQPDRIQQKQEQIKQQEEAVREKEKELAPEVEKQFEVAVAARYKGQAVSAQEAPADDTAVPFRIETVGGAMTDTVSAKLLKAYFTANATAGPAAPAAVPAPGAAADAAPAAAPALKLASTEPVIAQLVEVKTVLKLIQRKLADTPAPAGRLALLKGWLLPQAETYALRLEYQEALALNDKTGQPKGEEQLKADAAKLQAALEARFKAVLDRPAMTLSPIDPGDKAAPDYAKRKAEIEAMPDSEKLAKSSQWRLAGAKDEAERRRRVAHLLTYLDTDAAWQKRVMVVVGMRRYVQALNAQVQRAYDMILAVERLIPDDQASFTRHETQLRERATRNAERARAVAEIRAALTEQKITQDDAVSRRDTQLKELVAQLNKVKGEVDELLVRQTGIEKQLYEVQREVALTLEEVYRLERLLTNVERERYGLPPAGEAPNPK